MARKEQNENEICKGYKYRIYPTPEQEELFYKHFNCYRFVYNYFLDKIETDYKTTGKSKSQFDYCKDLIPLKEANPWLKEVDSHSLQYAIAQMYTAMTRWWKKIAEHPHFKSRKGGDQSYSSSGFKIVQDGKYIKVPKVGLVATRNSFHVEGRVVRGTIIKAASGRWYCSLNVMEEKPIPLPVTDNICNVSMDEDNINILIDGVPVEFDDRLKTDEKRITLLQQQVSWKQKGSNNYEKARMRLARYNEKVANRRTDFLQKLSTELIRKYQTIVIQKVMVKELQQENTKDENKELSFISYYEFGRQLKYKAGWYGRTVIDLNEPTEEEKKQKAEERKKKKQEKKKKKTKTPEEENKE